MSTFKGRGIVLNAQDYGEADIRLTLLLKEYGKLCVSAKGAKKQKSKFLAGTQLFTYSDFVIYDGGRFFTMAHIDIIESFYGIREQYETYVLCAYFAELYDRYIMPDEPCDQMLLLLISAMWVLEKKRSNMDVVRGAMQFKFLQFSGYSPEYELYELPLCPEALKAVLFLLHAPVKDAFGFSLSPEALGRLCAASDTLMRRHFPFKLKSRLLLDKVVSAGNKPQ